MLEKGTKLSHYRLEEMIGKGGMGEVWRATDGRLGREVALKVLPEIVTRDANRLDRFAREAKLLASLNHPGIATIHDVDEHQGIRFLVMELVSGEDLGETLQRGALPLAEALDTAVQIARAVEAAHSQGVIHRDLKPANVKRAPGGPVKVLDFGLAKAMEPDPVSGERDVALSPTVTSAGTVAGMILGTAAYMSPEQARGQEIDKRTDVWSFGVVLYEFLTGDNPFHGTTVADSVGAIMHRDPDLGALPAQTPTAIRRLLRRCLTREREDRLHDIADARIELEEAIANPVVETAASGAATAAPPSKLPWVALAVLVPLAAALAWWVGSREAPAAPAAMRQFVLHGDAEVGNVKISPDGTRLVYIVDNELFLRSLDSLDSRKIDDEDVHGPLPIFWSPDGRSLGYCTARGEIKRIDLDGGAPTTLITRTVPVEHAVWGDDGLIYFIEFQGGVFQVPAAGGAAKSYIDRHEAMLDYHGMDVLPDGKGILTIPHLEAGNNIKILLDRPGHDTVVVHESDSTINRVLYSPTGHILFEREEDPRGLWALPFSVSSLTATGPPFLVVADLSTASASRTGDLVYARSALSGSEREQRIVWTDRRGEIVDRLELPVYGGTLPVRSPDGTRLALVAKGVGRPAMDKHNLWVVDLDRGTATRLTEGGTRTVPPIWSPDGTRVAFSQDSAAGQGQISAIRADGTGSPESLTTTGAMFFFTLSRDWEHLAIMVGSMTNESLFDISVETEGDPSTARTIVAGPDLDVAPAIHPDGNWFAYMSGEMSGFDVYVRRFPSGEGQWKVSVGGGMMPFWSADGSQLFYFKTEVGTGEPNELMEVSFDGSGEVPKLGAPVNLFIPAKAQITSDIEGRFIQVADKDEADDEDRAATTGIVLIENWLSRFGES
jgi:Tol biopolymer transport system component